MEEVPLGEHSHTAQVIDNMEVMAMGGMEKDMWSWAEGCEGRLSDDSSEGLDRFCGEIERPGMFLSH